MSVHQVFRRWKSTAKASFLVASIAGAMRWNRLAGWALIVFYLTLGLPLLALFVVLALPEIIAFAFLVFLAGTGIMFAIQSISRWIAGL